MNYDLTKTINSKIAGLKEEVRSLPSGGGIEILKMDLENIQRSVGDLIQNINEVYYTLMGLDPDRF